MPVEEKHKYYFELYYHLGVDRSVAKLAKIQMPRMFPELAPDSREYRTKFNSLYTKIKRWEEREGWQEEAEKREGDNRRQADVLVREQEQTLTSTVELYSRMISYLLQKFAEKITRDEVEIKSLKEAKLMMELQMFLRETLQGRPHSVGSKVYELMNQDERRQADIAFEWLRKKVRSEPLLLGLQEIVEAETVVEAGVLVPERLPEHKPVEIVERSLPEKERRVPAFLRPIDIPRPEDMSAVRTESKEEEE